MNPENILIVSLGCFVFISAVAHILIDGYILACIASVIIVAFTNLAIASFVDPTHSTNAFALISGSLLGMVITVPTGLITKVVVRDIREWRDAKARRAAKAEEQDDNANEARCINEELEEHEN